MKKLCVVAILLISTLVLIGAGETSVIRDLQGTIRAYTGTDGVLTMGRPVLKVLRVYPPNYGVVTSNIAAPKVVTNNVPATIYLNSNSPNTFVNYTATSYYKIRHNVLTPMQAGSSYTITVQPKLEDSTIDCGGVMIQIDNNTCESTFTTN